jgi:transposase InsO family protein
MAPLDGGFNSTPIWHIAMPGAGAVHPINGGHMDGPLRRHRPVLAPGHWLVCPIPHDHDLALQALPMAVWRRKPDNRVTVHSGQGSQFTGREWQTFLRQHDLEPSMSRRGNCHDNAVAQSFFQFLKRERIRRRTYPTRDAARQDMFECIELFSNPKHKHTDNGTLSPVDFEIRQQKLKKAGV